MSNYTDMYTILINNDNTLTKSVIKNIMHRSSMVDKFHILANPMYNDFDMREFTCVMEYVLPISKQYIVEILTPSAELYKEKIEYTLPVNTQITSEIGNVELKFTFTKLEMLEDGSKVERVRKTSSTAITILKVEQWSDYISDAKLDPVVQMLLNVQAQNEQSKVYLEQLQDAAEILMTTKGDSLYYDSETNELQLQANGEPISSVTLEECNLEDGVPVVDFDNGGEKPDDDDNEYDNVVEF